MVSSGKVKNFEMTKSSNCLSLSKGGCFLISSYIKINLMTSGNPVRRPPSLAEQREQYQRSMNSSFLVMSREGYQNNSSNIDGKNVFWTTDVHTELPIHMESGDGPATLEPITVPSLFKRNVKSEPKRDALQVERDGKVIKWNW